MILIINLMKKNNDNIPTVNVPHDFLYALKEKKNK